MKSATRQFIVTASGILAIVFSGTFALAQSADPITSASRINSANALLRDGKLDEAITEYRQITPSDDQRDALNYNEAVARYRAGDVESAASLFADAAASDDSDVAAKARYNLGNTFYAKALQTADRDKPTAIQQLRTAIGHYRSSLRLDANNADARANIELAALLIRSLEDQQKQQQEEQQQDEQESQSPNEEQQEDSQEQQSDNQEQQPSDQSQSENSESQQNQSGENADADDAEQPQASGEPQSDDETSDGERSEAQDDSQQSEQQSQEARQRPRDSQQTEDGRDEAAAQDSDEQNESDPQDVPTGELTAAAENNDDQNPNERASMADPNATHGLMTREEALKMLQAVRDRDMLRRLRQQQMERSRRIPVDRDW